MGLAAASFPPYGSEWAGPGPRGPGGRGPAAQRPESPAAPRCQRRPGGPPIGLRAAGTESESEPACQAESDRTRATVRSVPAP
eukprot:383017-Hanusia_phi.AAC.1